MTHDSPAKRGSGECSGVAFATERVALALETEGNSPHSPVRERGNPGLACTSVFGRESVNREQSVD